jgi:hypothetical protein
MKPLPRSSDQGSTPYVGQVQKPPPSRRDVLKSVFVGFPVAICLVLVLAGCAVDDGVEAARPAPAPDPSINLSAAELQVMKNQNHIHAVIEPLLANLDPKKAAAIPGYAGVIVDAAHDHFTLFWKGEPPASVTEALAMLPPGMTAEVRPAAFSKAELHAQRDQLFKDDAATPAEYRAHRIGVREDGSGLDVSVPKARPVSFTRAGGSNVRLLVEAPDHPLSRQADRTPYWGGSRIFVVNGSLSRACTSGFILTDGTYFHTTTAAHCAQAVGMGFQVLNGNQEPIGTVLLPDLNPPIGIDLIRLAPNSAAAKIYDGVWNDSLGTNKPVIGQMGSGQGDWLCTSGSFSGTVCNIQVTNPDTTTNTNPALFVAEAREVSGKNAAGDGDSGGPVFSLTGTGSMLVARGTIEGGRDGTEVACTGVPAGPIRKCYNKITYVRIADTLNIFSLTLQRPQLWWVDTFQDATVYDSPGGNPSGTLYRGTNYVYCKVRGPSFTGSFGTNYYWLFTDPDVGSARQWVPAYYLSHWGDNVAKDNNGIVIPDC